MVTSFEEYQRLTKQRRNVADALGQADVAEIEFDPASVSIDVRPADFT